MHQPTATHSLWNGLTMRPDNGWAGNLCTTHLEALRDTRYLQGFEIRDQAEGDTPCYVCERLRLDPWPG